MTLVRTTVLVGIGACCLAAAIGRIGNVRHTVGLAKTVAATAAPPTQRIGAPAEPAWIGVEIPADRVGHYRTEVRIDGFTVPVIVDTGATFLHLTETDARRLGLPLRDEDFRYRTNTANGIAAVAMTTLHEVQLGGIRLQDVKATVARGADLSESLLGMSFLGRLSRVEAANGRLILRP